MEAVIFDGKEYLKASVLAERFNYTQDYLGQLCRAKKVDARLVGRAWYINLDSLNGHKKTRYKTSEKAISTEVVPEALASSQQRYLTRIDVEPVLKRKTVKILKNHKGRLTEFPVKYEKDEYSLIPRISREAISKPIVILPAEAEDLSIKSEKESLKVTTFKAEPLPEVYLKGRLKVDGLPEALEPLSDLKSEKSTVGAVEQVFSVAPKALSPNEGSANLIQGGAKKPIKIKLYRNSPAQGVQKQPVIEGIKRAENLPLVSNTHPASLPQKARVSERKNLPVQRFVEKSIVQPVKPVSEAVVIPFATLKATMIFLLAVIISSAVLLPKQEVVATGMTASPVWSISLDQLREIEMFFLSQYK